MYECTSGVGCVPAVFPREENICTGIHHDAVMGAGGAGA